MFLCVGERPTAPGAVNQGVVGRANLLQVNDAMETPLLCKFVDFLAIRDANTPRRCDNLTAVGDKNWLIFHYTTLLFLLLFYGFWVVAYILAHYSGRRLCTTAM